MEIVFYNVQTFFELVDPENDNYEGHLISWMLQYFFGAKKLCVFADLFYLGTMGYSA